MNQTSRGQPDKGSSPDRPPSKPAGVTGTGPNRQPNPIRPDLEFFKSSLAPAVRLPDSGHHNPEDRPNNPNLKLVNQTGFDSARKILADFNPDNQSRPRLAPLQHLRLEATINNIIQAGRQEQLNDVQINYFTDVNLLSEDSLGLYNYHLTEFDNQLRPGPNHSFKSNRELANYRRWLLAGAGYWADLNKTSHYSRILEKLNWSGPDYRNERIKRLRLEIKNKFRRLQEQTCDCLAYNHQAINRFNNQATSPETGNGRPDRPPARANLTELIDLHSHQVKSLIATWPEPGPRPPKTADNVIVLANFNQPGQEIILAADLIEAARVNLGGLLAKYCDLIKCQLFLQTDKTELLDQLTEINRSIAADIGRIVEPQLNRLGFGGNGDGQALSWPIQYELNCLSQNLITDYRHQVLSLADQPRSAS